MSTTPFLLPKSSTGPTRKQSPSRWPDHFHTWIRIWLPVALLTLVFAAESQARFGSDHTSQPLHTFFQALFGNITDQNWELLHHLIRKTGHFLAYGTLGLLCFRSLYHTQRYTFSIFQLHAFALLATFAVASADEIHQCYLPNRTGTFTDVLLDCAGAATLLLILQLTVKPRSPRELAESAESLAAAQTAVA